MTEGPDGPEARLTGPQGSGILTSMVLANALLIIPEGQFETPADATVQALRLDDPILGGAMVWGYMAIVVQQQQRPLVALFAGLAAALVLLSLFVRDRQAPHSTHSECAEV